MFAGLVGAWGKPGHRGNAAPPPRIPGSPPPPLTPKVDEYRYAKLADNPQVFVIRADKLTDLFAKADSLRDPQLARFTSDEVQELTITVPGKPAVKLLRKAEKWTIDAKPEPVAAEQSAVTELISQLSGLRSIGSEPAAIPDGGATV